MEDDTIVTDVIETEKPLSQREQAMQSILATRNPDESQDDIVQPDDTPKEGDEITLKIDGTEVKAPKEKVIEAGVRALQKESAADKRLYEVSAKEQALKQREEELARMEQDLLTKRNQLPDETGKEFADAIFTDPETVAKTISTIARQVQDVSAKVERVEQTEVKKQQSTLQVVFDHYLTEYQDIAGDEDMHEAANKRFKRIAAQRTPTTADVDQIAKDVYQKFGRVTAEPPPDPATVRKQAKENMPAPVKRASARVAPTPAEQPKTPSQIIDQMRRGRGPRAY